MISGKIFPQCDFYTWEPDKDKASQAKPKCVV